MAPTGAPRGGPPRRHRYGARTRPCGATGAPGWRACQGRDESRQCCVSPRGVVGMHPFEPGMTPRSSPARSPADARWMAGEQQGPVGGGRGQPRPAPCWISARKRSSPWRRGLFRAGLLGPRAPQIERAHHGGPTRSRWWLDDVVRGARLDVFRRGFFVQAAGHDDDRRVRRLEERDAQRIGRSERG